MNVEKYLKISKVIDDVIDKDNKDDIDTLFDVMRHCSEKLPLWALQMIADEKDQAYEGQELTLAALVHDYGYNNITVNNVDGEEIATGYDEDLLEIAVYVNNKIIELRDLVVVIDSLYKDDDGFTCIIVKSTVKVDEKNLSNYEDMPF